MVILFILLTAVGLLFRDDGSRGGFVSEQLEQEFYAVYAEAMAELPAAAEEFFLETDFGRVKIYRFVNPGTEGKIPLLLLPGKSAPTPLWEANLADLMAARPVYALDILGEPGLSVETVRIQTAADQAAWLQQVLQQLPEPELHLLGLSFGGWSAANLALHAPEKIASLVLVDPVHVFAGIPLKMILKTIPASLPSVSQEKREAMLSYISGGAAADPSITTARLIETAMRAFKSKLPTPARLSEAQVAAIPLPVLGIIAENSAIHASARAMACGEAQLSHALSEMVLFEDASHALNGEYPQKLAQTVADFLTKVENER